MKNTAWLPNSDAASAKRSKSDRRRGPFRSCWPSTVSRTLERVRGLRLPGLAAGVPADQAQVGDLRRRLLEALAPDVAVHCQLGDLVAAPGHGHRLTARLVRRPCRRAEHERPILDEEDAGPCAAVACGEL